MKVTLERLKFTINGIEERPLYTQFKVITNKELPKVSDHTQTQIGRFVKTKGLTKLKWDYEDQLNSYSLKADK